MAVFAKGLIILGLFGQVVLGAGVPNAASAIGSVSELHSLTSIDSQIIASAVTTQVLPAQVLPANVVPAQLLPAYAANQRAAGSQAANLPDQPHIIPREVWGAREPSCTWAGTDGNRVTHVVIHHTYEETGEPSLESAYEALQHIQNLHMDQNDWCDIGYSYLVDWFGNVYEGSRGTIDRPITSAHTAGMNYEGVGIALIGRYTDEPPTDAAIEAAGRVAGWVLGFYGYTATQDVNLTVAGGNNRWANGTRITVPAITGHRDLVRTECPGEMAYARLDEVRANAAAITSAMQSGNEFGLGSTGLRPIFALGEPSGPIVPSTPNEQTPSQPRPGFGGSFADMITEADPETLVEQSLQLWWIGGGVFGIGALGAVWWFRSRRARATATSRPDRAV